MSLNRTTSAVRNPVHVTLFAPAAATVWTDQPSAVTEFLGLVAHRTQIDLTDFRLARVVINVGSVAGFSGATLRVQYSVDAGSTWTNLTGTAVADDDLSTQVSAWTTIAEAAQKDVLVRIVGAGGNATVDPSFGSIALQLAR